MKITPSPQVSAPVAADAARAAEPPAASSVASSAGGIAAQPAVTVDLSDAARAALAARTSSTSADTAPAEPAKSGGVPAIVLRAEHLAGMIADGSTASDADKATALAGLYQLRFKSGGYATGADANGWFNQSTQAQRDQINNTVDKSAFFKQAVSAASQFNADGMAIARAGQSSDSSLTPHARFNQLPADQQVLVWAGGASQFGTLEQYSAFLQQQAQATPPSPSAGPNSPPSGSKDQAYSSGQTDAPGSVVSRIA